MGVKTSLASSSSSSYTDRSSNACMRAAGMVGAATATATEEDSDDSECDGSIEGIGDGEDGSGCVQYVSAMTEEGALRPAMSQLASGDR
jgi:hypothetical protein